LYQDRWHLLADGRGIKMVGRQPLYATSTGRNALFH